MLMKGNKSESVPHSDSDEQTVHKIIVVMYLEIKVPFPAILCRHNTQLFEMYIFTRKSNLGYYKLALYTVHTQKCILMTQVRGIIMLAYRSLLYNFEPHSTAVSVLDDSPPVSL